MRGAVVCAADGKDSRARRPTAGTSRRIRVALIEPSFTKTNLDINAPQTAARIPVYDSERSVVAQAIQNNVQKAPQPDGVASTIVEAALGAWKMRHTPKGEASLLSKLRRFMPAGPVEKGLRKTFGLV